jgi:uncharacterized protein YbcV (DUF1398 family)
MPSILTTAIETIAQACMHGAEANTMSFPEIVGTLMQAGFESYTIDFRRSTAIYYLPNGESVELATHTTTTPIADRLDAATVQAAIREAQTQAADYTYFGFCDKVRQAGCAGYIVSFLGRRVVYFARTAEIHVEHFPD